MLKDKELLDEELDKVTDGCAGEDGINTNGQFTGFMNMYTLHDSKYFGQEFYVIDKYTGGFYWYRGKLLDSFEEWNWFATRCVHKFEITNPGNTDYYCGKNVKTVGDNVGVYTTKNF